MIFSLKGFRGFKTAIYINSKVIYRHYRKNKWREGLEYFANEKDRKIMFFINSKPDKKRK